MLSDKEKKELTAKLAQVGLPAGFTGDRLDAFRAGLFTAAERIAPLVEYSAKEKHMNEELAERDKVATETRAIAEKALIERGEIEAVEAAR